MSPFGGGKTILFFEVHEVPVSPHVDQAAETNQKASSTTRSTVSTDCARRTDEVIHAHLETISPASPCCTSSATATTCAKADESHAVAIEVPEIASQEVAGEWLIPKDGILLVGFGPHTVAGKDGKAVIRERLAIIEAEAVTDGAVQRTSRVPGLCSVIAARSAGRDSRASSHPRAGRPQSADRRPRAAEPLDPAGRPPRRHSGRTASAPRR